VKKAFASFDHIYQQTTTITIKFRVTFYINLAQKENGIWKVIIYLQEKSIRFQDTKEIFKSFMHFERPPIK
jgi:hypothetical protein